jgi:hypothetical protein
MLTITQNAWHEKISAGDNEVVLTGPPAELRGHLTLTNNNDEMVKVRALPVMQTGSEGSMGVAMAPLKFSCRLNPGEQKIESILHQLPLDTAPGTYESSIMVGGEQRKLKMIVQGLIDINIHPQNFSFLDSSPGKTHTATFAVTNLGNMSFQVPDVKHVTTLDMDFLCRAAALAIRNKGNEGYTQMMDELTKSIHNDMADWVHVSVKESGTIIAPGETMILNLELTLPKDVDAKKDYAGNVRFWDKEITYVIKSHLGKN